MAFKFIAAFAFCSALVVVNAAPYIHHEESGGHEHEVHSGGSSHASIHLVSHDDHHDEHGHEHGDGHDSHAEYHFKYGVEDKKTGDYKEHSEKRDGHKVTGHYELIDADGHKRTVHYTADKHSGFHAIVHREPTHHHIADHGHTSYYGGYAHLEEHHGGEHGHEHGHGHGHHGHESGFSIKQEHGVPFHHEAHHESAHEGGSEGGH
ncbi:PREDICTED: histidine-rich glycoprotein-like [Bactrocera latifrons]|uniref:Pupal cuticle protein Edg-84A n=1 Tax=Bactrocera latifrons TaxID=174628 RepID=A0A0K8U5I3_BACLA|nr:PREDICTED: histidine-rich glycoprotein-like [Bactrocera latifrons]